jgi:hypothetical protein
VFSEDLGPCVPVWKTSSRTCGYKWSLLKVRKGNTKGALGVHVESAGKKSVLFLFQVLLKPTLTHGEGRQKRFLPNK